MFKVVKMFLCYLVVQFGILFLMVFNYINKGNDPNLVSNYINDNRVYIVLLLGIIFIPILYYKYKKFDLKEEKIKDIHILILLGISLSLIYNVFGFYFDKLLNTNLYGVFDIKTTLISTVLIGPVIEEYLFRGVMYNEAKKIYSLKKSVLIVTLIFSLSHATLIQMIYAFIIGLVLIRVYEKYKNINSCIIVHLFSNLTTTFLTILLIKNNLLLNLFIFVIGFFIIYFIKDKKCDII